MPDQGFFFGLMPVAVLVSLCNAPVVSKSGPVPRIPHAINQWACYYGSDSASLSRLTDFDLVVIDPPRAGAREALVPLAQLARHHVALCSCNSATLAREIASLTQAGFALEEVCLVDMFPHTEHVEVLAWLARRQRTDPRRAASEPSE